MALSPVLYNQSLRHLNTFGLDVTAAALLHLEHRDDLTQLTDLVQAYPQLLILGGGSNLLFTRNFEGLVVWNRLKGIAIEPDPDSPQHQLLKASGGESWHELVMYAVHHQLGGIENLALIPGTVGAAPIQNIGAYGVELKDVFHSLEAFDLETGKLQTFDKDNCMFGYRSSIFKHEFKGKYLIVSCTLRLSLEHTLHTSYGAIQTTLKKKGIEHPRISDIAEAVIDIRRSKLPDPQVLGNAGSFFKNPEISLKHFEQLQQDFPDIPGYPVPGDLIKVPAGWLIETCGWKGRRMGNTGAHAQQALVLVNYGNATGEEIYEHAQRIIRNVKERFEITLVPEVNII
ncbi:MAG: UDP-N-acetylenolpyruvoylglucosamine reductase [Sphingobacteriales bacterium BACL12 MAG-120802-bin5]|nr:MAG: UDP-N-acetylenolpyruvoylglucosamine reductase [Sphingobacteriales bacterium BACL12 MAG-120802-bin5]